MNVVEINRNTIILTLKNNINYKISVIIISVEINSGLISVLPYRISERAEIFSTYNKIGISVGICSGSTGGRTNYFIFIKNRVELTKN